VRTETRFSELVAQKRRRERRRISYRMIAEETGMSISSVKNWGKGQLERFDGPQIAAFCRYLNCTPNDLFVLIYDDDDDFLICRDKGNSGKAS
jgi:DNA-binding Xre family transcriptional regulator